MQNKHSSNHSDSDRFIISPIVTCQSGKSKVGHGDRGDFFPVQNNTAQVCMYKTGDDVDDSEGSGECGPVDQKRVLFLLFISCQLAVWCEEKQAGSGGTCFALFTVG